MNTLIVDGSYYVFHRYYATLRWLSHQPHFKELMASSEEGATAHIEFMEAFKRHAHNDFDKLRFQHKAGPLIIAMDCPRSDIWRMAIYPDYKGMRVIPVGADGVSFDSQIFQLFYAWIWKERPDIQVYYSPCLEADDCAYLLAKSMTARDPSMKIICISNDNDYLQMKCDQISVYNLKGDDISLRGCGDSGKDLMIKILMGDKSDNIPPVCPGIGPKTAEKLAGMSESEREAWLTKKAGSKEAWMPNYERNRMLIDWRCIPAHYVPQKIELEDEIDIKTRSIDQFE